MAADIAQAEGDAAEVAELENRIQTAMYSLAFDHGRGTFPTLVPSDLERSAHLTGGSEAEWTWELFFRANQPEHDPDWDAPRYREALVAAVAEDTGGLQISPRRLLQTHGDEGRQWRLRRLSRVVQSGVSTGPHATAPL